MQLKKLSELLVLELYDVEYQLEKAKELFMESKMDSISLTLKEQYLHGNANAIEIMLNRIHKILQNNEELENKIE